MEHSITLLALFGCLWHLITEAKIVQLPALEPAPGPRLFTDPADHAREIAGLRAENAQNRALLNASFK